LHEAVNLRQQLPLNLLQQHTRIVREKAIKLGFDQCRFAKAERLDDDARRLEQWLHKGLHGSMQYMENHFDLRIDPGKLVPGAKSVITLLLNYYPATSQAAGGPMISKYAYGKDYHEVIKEKLRQLLAEIRSEIGNIAGRGFVDSAPVLERAWAQKSGLGWIGRNGNLINKQQGSFLFIATLITDLEFDYDEPFAADHCGTCTKCVEACPTDAILPGKTIDGSRCISYFTIELKEAIIPEEFKGKFSNWAFGCDICQDVCPWNRFSKATKEPQFNPLPGILDLTTEEWELMSEEKFNNVFRHSAIKRAKHKGLMRNLRFLKNQN
jgi:epoxyqueuosine reductase